MKSERTQKTLYRIYSIKRQTFFNNGQLYSTPAAAYAAWARRTAQYLSTTKKRKKGDGWHGNYEMQKIVVVTTTKVVKTLKMVTKRDRKIQQQIADIIGGLENV